MTVHGFARAFKSWAGDRTTFPREIIEASLTHAIPDALEKAYRRTDFFEKRVKLMEAWAAYCTSAPSSAKILPLARK